MVDLDLLEELWPSEDRPRKLQTKEGLRGFSMPKLMEMKQQFEKESERKGLGTAVFSRDKKPKTRKFKKMRDDGESKLHPARFESLPISDPKKYWEQVPTAKSEIYRHIPLQHLGVKNVPETTIVKLHNRKVPIELSMLNRELTETRHVQQAVYNHVAILRSLHPIDHSALAVQKVLIDADWGKNMGKDEKERISIIRRFFDEVARENSGRAVRKEPPLDPEQVRILIIKKKFINI